LKEREIRFILPTRDGELAYWSKLRSRLLQEGIDVVVSAEKTLEIAMDKLQFSKWLQENSFQHISTWTDLTQVTAQEIVIKERFADAPKNTVLNVKPKDALEFSKSHREPVFQEYIPGVEISVDVWAHSSGEVSCLARTRDLIIDGEARVTSLFVNRQLESLAVRISKKIGLKGPGVLQFIQNEDGNFYPIECNARIGGASTFSINAKFDSLYLSLCEVFNESPVNQKAPQNFSTQVRAMKDYYL
jgi:carbamoyl-phosphate synthase large subunit